MANGNFAWVIDKLIEESGRNDEPAPKIERKWEAYHHSNEFPPKSLPKQEG